MTEPRLIGLFVVKDEGDRYLEKVLRWHSQFCDELFVFDDQSTDDTALIAQDFATVVVRPDGPAFMANESQFRQQAWTAMSEALQPAHARDWVLCLDADEFFAASEGTERDALDWLLELSGESWANCVDLRIDEIFNVAGDVPERRLDGFWGDIHASRLVRYLDGGRFTNKEMGGGSVPNYALYPYNARTQPFSILHFGYAEETDRADKYARYSSKRGNGHNPTHIESILTEPTLEPVTLKRPLW